MHPALGRLDHRPWPIPAAPWAWRQSWRDLLFAHWRIDAGALRPLIPASLRIDEFDGDAWIGVVPFRMTGVMRRPLPDLPFVSSFPELNVRTYVERDGKPGVWFFSLDAASRLAVWAARRFFHLPYFHSSMSLDPDGDGVLYKSVRQDHPRPAVFRARYRPTSAPAPAAPGSLDAFLTERYALYAEAPDGRLLRTEVHHAPWPLLSAAAEIEENSMLAPLGLRVEGPPAALHFARRLDVVVWSPSSVP